MKYFFYVFIDELSVSMNLLSLKEDSNSIIKCLNNA